MLCQKTFALGWFRFTDQTKMQIFVAIKSFLVVWVLLLYTDDSVSNFIGFNLKKNHQELVERLNKISELFGSTIELKIEFTVFMMALLASFISFSIVKHCINFAFYFFVTKRKANESTPEEINTIETG